MSSWKQQQISPVVAWVTIIVVVAIAAFTIWRYTGSPGRKGMTEEQRRQMEQMFGNQPPGPGTRAPSPGAPAPTAPSTR
ncbi:MAG: hypothetical protein K6U75_13155 [Firmicutes bacterium]|nr:hypothetical protein [Bacillota bacterium]